LTKESGRAGGFEEKIEAALDLGIPVVAVKNPERTEHIQGEGQKVFSSALEVLEEIGHLTGREELCCRQEEEPAELTIVSAGPGGRQHLTREACDTVDQAEIVFGAPSVIEKARQSGLLSGNRPCRGFYQAEKIFSFLQDHTEIRKGTVLVSGDAGLYSGAALIRKTWEKLGENRIRIRVLPGISSVSALAAALEVSWEDAAVLSIHGRKVNIIRHLQRKSRIFLLTEGPHDLQQTADRLEEALLQGLLPGSLRIGYGYNLSMEGEEKGFISLDQMKTLTKQGLYILYLENPAAGNTPVTACLEDDAFLRRCSPGEENVPMTKEEVRVLALSRLRLTPGAVFYDIGAGTGSISIEAARLCPDARIFAVEKRPAAVRILRENLDRYCLYDVHVVEKAAPEGLRDLPAPTHVFIGGSGKAIPDILTEVLLKNKGVRIVLTCITLETLTQVMETVRALPVTKLRVRQIAAARAEKTGPYHMLKAQNPVFLIDFEGLGDEEGAGEN
jgi:precorrin-6Y C5,15-methyltransferase (decarboxylating)